MKNFDYGKKYHYMIKYGIMFLPLLLLILGNFWVNDVNVLTLLNSYVESLFQSLRSYELNSFYNTLLDTIGFDSSSGLSFILESYPLYIIWLYVFDLFVDLFGLIPRLAHKFITKFGGDY